MPEIRRPVVHFDGASHTYTNADGERLWGVSSVAKIGEAEDSFSIGAAWGFRLGVEGANEVYGDENVSVYSNDDLRAELKRRGLTPWSTRDRAADRGNWVHDVLEALATDGTVPSLDGFSDEYRGHAKAVLQWYLDFRPQFVATEVAVASETYGFSGRYDIRCRLPLNTIIPNVPLLENRPALCLVDLKTSKDIYPTSHYPQLEGYELASVEMGFPPTDVRMVLNTRPDGTYKLGRSYATGEDFLAYLGALRAIKGIKARDPEVLKRKEIEAALLALLPAASRDVAGKPGIPDTAKEVGRILGGLRKRGKVRQDEQTKVWFRT